MFSLATYRLARLHFIFQLKMQACNVTLPTPVIRPPVTVVRVRTYKMLVMFFSFFSPTVLRAPSTDRPETLPPDRNLCVFLMQVQKLGGQSPKKIGGQKHAKFRSIFDHFRIWSRISPERLKISKIGRRYKLWQLLPRLTKKVRWTLVH